MPLCPNCGTDNHDTLEECMYCGESLKPQKQTNPQLSFQTHHSTSLSIGINTIFSIILSLIFPLIGFVLFYTASKKGQKFASLYLFAAVLNLIWTFLLTT